MAEKRERTSYGDLVRAVGAAERMAMIDVRRILDAATRIVNERTATGGEVVVGRLGTFRGTRTDEGCRVSFRRSTAAPRPTGGKASSAGLSSDDHARASSRNARQSTGNASGSSMSNDSGDL